MEPVPEPVVESVESVGEKKFEENAEWRKKGPGKPDSRCLKSCTAPKPRGCSGLQAGSKMSAHVASQRLLRGMYGGLHTPRAQRGGPDAHACPCSQPTSVNAPNHDPGATRGPLSPADGQARQNFKPKRAQMHLVIRSPRGPSGPFGEPDPPHG